MQCRRNFDLEERTTEFAKKVVNLCKKIRTNPVNIRIIPQVIAQAGSIGANYREANDSLGKKDFIHRLKIARKEAKETIHWLEMLYECEKNEGIKLLMGEATEL